MSSAHESPQDSKSPHDSATWVVLLTPAGRGAVATVRIEGPDTVASVGARFHAANGRRLAEQPLGSILFGRWFSGEETTREGEELVVVRTAPERVEVHCHGGLAAAGGIIQSLRDLGCQEATWRDRLALEEPDPIRAEALEQMTRARTERTAGILLDQYDTNALRREVEALAEQIEQGDFDTAGQRLDRLRNRGRLGLHLIEPWRVVLAGPPNVGKSSLINRLGGYRRSITHDVPGTTRDVVTLETAISGWPIRLADTAGLGETDEPIEHEGIERARREVAEADLVVWVADASEPATSWNSDPEVDAIRIANKCDLTGERLFGEVLPTSAVTGEGLEALSQRIAERLVPNRPIAGEAIPFTRRQVDFLDRAWECFESKEPGRARELLLSMLSR